MNQAAAYIKSGFPRFNCSGRSRKHVTCCKWDQTEEGCLLIPPRAIPGNLVPQGISADLIASKYGYTREATDAFAAESQRRAAEAERKRLVQITYRHSRPNWSTDILHCTDENIRPGTTAASLATPPPAFQMMGAMAGFDDVALDKYPEVETLHHVHHAGNSSAIVDGAAISLIGSEEAGKQMGLKPRFKIRTAAIDGTDPTIMLTGPAPATRKALKQAGMNIGDIDLIEVNEAFSRYSYVIHGRNGHR